MMRKHIFVILGFIGVASIWGFFQYRASISDANIGEAGDSFGSLNALFTGLAFVGLIWTIRQQAEQLKSQQEELKNNTEQLSLQREELKLQREEMRVSNKELKGQKEALEKQNFQAMFASLISLYDNKLTNIEFGEKKGVNALSHLLYNFVNFGFTEKQVADTGINPLTGELKPIESYRWKLWTFKNTAMSIINVLMQTHLFVRNSDITDADKDAYQSLLFNLLSHDEFRIVDKYLTYIRLSVENDEGDPSIEAAMENHDSFYKEFRKQRLEFRIKREEII